MIPSMSAVERPPFPPFTEADAWKKVLAAEAAWNTRDPDRVVLAYTEDTQWRNRDEFLSGRDQVHAFLVRKWEKELDSETLQRELADPSFVEAELPTT